MLRTLLRATVAAGVGLILVAGATVAVAETDAPTVSAVAGRPLAVVSLGDSYISGEAGRWKGNSVIGTGDRGGTDRAWITGSTYDPARIYGPTAATGCHRSDVAPITHVRLLRPATINLACSGAATANVLRASAGGVPFKGEAPQNDQLALIARQYRVTAIALSIGGNDLGFSSIVSTCVVAFLTRGTPCSVSLAPSTEALLPVVQAAVGRVVDDVRATMADAGYGPHSYRLILQSYPVPQPSAVDARYPEAGPDRQTIGGCPFLDADLQWGHDGIAAQLTETLRAAARDRRVQFLDLTNAFRGHELCSASATQPTGAPDDRTNEWVRWIDLAGQGDLNESFHPNAFGQEAMGRCLAITLLFLSGRDVACHATAGRSPRAVFVLPAR